MVRTCSPGSKKFAKRVKACNGSMACIKFGDRNMTIKKHIPSRKKSFCARHRCHLKKEPATPGYQSCKKWNCKVGSCRKRSPRSKRSPKRTFRSPKSPRVRNPKTGRMVLKSGKLGQTLIKKKKSVKSKTSKSGKKYSRCWSGYKKKGYKLKNGRRVPNCVKA